MNISVLGAGSWGITLAVLLHGKGHRVTMWEYDEADARMLDKERVHTVKLPGIRIPEDITITNTVAHAVHDDSYVVCAVPTQNMRQAMRQVATVLHAHPDTHVHGWIIVSKGIEHSTRSLMTEVLEQELPGDVSRTLAVLSGPSHAEEVSRSMPTTVVVASHNPRLAAHIQQHFTTDTFRLYTNEDVRGVQIAASIKNVIAIATGICDGLGFGDNTRGALLTRGMLEMIRLGKNMGAQEATFTGLAGMGDLVTTCVSKHSRNRRIGELIGSGYSLAQAAEKMVMVAEGVETAKAVYHLAKQYDIDMPITREVYCTLFENKPPQQAVSDLMARKVKPERWGVD
jgi:glycerol-3-phosphate dehydrogenase (NAD(P)+)